MSYTPPGPTSLNFDFTEIQRGSLFFDFSDLYSPPDFNALHFDFTVPLFPLDFVFALPPPPEPWYDPLWDAREFFKDLAIWCTCQLRGQIAHTWTFRVRRNKQQVYPYAVPTDPKTPAQLACRSKFASCVSSWKSLSPGEKDYWEIQGANKKEQLPGYNAFLSACMNGKV